MRIARVFPSRTKATPTDALAFVDAGPGARPPEVDEVHVSVAFSWHRKRAEELAEAWKNVAPVRIGGPGWSDAPEGVFVPGRYLREGYTITSRGCPNRFWYCRVWRRLPEVVELPIASGWNVLDDNLLACSDDHVWSVFAMLKRRKERIELTGGLEAARLRPWHVALFRRLRAHQVFFAYDAPEDLEALAEAARLMWDGGFVPKWHTVRAYVLVGWPKDGNRAADTFAAAERRLAEVRGLGVMPAAMLWRGEDGARDPEWVSFQARWFRPAKIAGREKNAAKEEER